MVMFVWIGDDIVCIRYTKFLCMHSATQSQTLITVGKSGLSYQSIKDGEFCGVVDRFRKGFFCFGIYNILSPTQFKWLNVIDNIRIVLFFSFCAILLSKSIERQRCVLYNL